MVDLEKMKEVGEYLCPLLCKHGSMEDETMEKAVKCGVVDIDGMS